MPGLTIKPPDPQNALDLFAGEWASRLPRPLDQLRAGDSLLFDDPRVRWAIDRIGGVQDKSVLELGPLEGGHTFMLDRGGAKQVMAIEANERAFLRCLVVKELLGIPAARFVHGDFVAYLAHCDARFDVVFASGVLYHLQDPVALIELLSRVTDTLYLWTMYYDEAVLQSSSSLRHRIVEPTMVDYKGLTYRLYRHDYLAAAWSSRFCGGTHKHAHWLTRPDIIRALGHFGFDYVEESFDEPLHENGSALAIIARKASPG